MGWPWVISHLHPNTSSSSLSQSIRHIKTCTHYCGLDLEKCHIICEERGGRWEVKLWLIMSVVGCLWLVCCGSGIYIAGIRLDHCSQQARVCRGGYSWQCQVLSSTQVGHLQNHHAENWNCQVSTKDESFFFSRISGSLYCQRPDTLTSTLCSSSTSPWNSLCMSLLFVSSCALSLGKDREVNKDPTGTTTGVNLDQEDNSSSEASATTIPATTEIITTETTATIEDQSKVVDVQVEMHLTTSSRWERFWKVFNVLFDDMNVSWCKKSGCKRLLHWDLIFKLDL